MFPLTGNPKIDKEILDEHERDLLEQAEADAMAKGEANEGDYQPLDETGDELIQAPRRNKHVGHDES